MSVCMPTQHFNLWQNNLYCISEIQHVECLGTKNKSMICVSLCTHSIPDGNRDRGNLTNTEAMNAHLCLVSQKSDTWMFWKPQPRWMWKLKKNVKGQKSSLRNKQWMQWRVFNSFYFFFTLLQISLLFIRTCVFSVVGAENTQVTQQC